MEVCAAHYFNTRNKQEIGGQSAHFRFYSACSIDRGWTAGNDGYSRGVRYQAFAAVFNITYWHANHTYTFH